MCVCVCVCVCVYLSIYLCIEERAGVEARRIAAKAAAAAAGVEGAGGGARGAGLGASADSSLRLQGASVDGRAGEAGEAVGRGDRQQFPKSHLHSGFLPNFLSYTVASSKCTIGH